MRLKRETFFVSCRGVIVDGHCVWVFLSQRHLRRNARWPSVRQRKQPPLPLPRRPVPTNAKEEDAPRSSKRMKQTKKYLYLLIFLLYDHGRQAAARRAAKKAEKKAIRQKENKKSKRNFEGATTAYASPRSKRARHHTIHPVPSPSPLLTPVRPPPRCEWVETTVGPDIPRLTFLSARNWYFRERVWDELFS